MAVASLLMALAALAGFFSSDPIRFFAPEGRREPVGILYFSGDMGLRFGIGAYASRELARRGFAVTGFNSPTAFRQQRSPAEVDAIVAGAVRQALARTGASRLVVVGQSYGADILQTGLAGLPLPLRSHVAAAILVVPGASVYFRADPTEAAYHGTPDGIGAASVNRLGWLPVTCIYGAAERDSLCPAVRLANATIVRMPGGHFLGHDDAGLFGEVLAAIQRVGSGGGTAATGVTG